jgi:GAF domain-containing protein
MTNFTERMSEAYSTEDVLPRMAAILQNAVGAERATIWLRVSGEVRPAASSPALPAPESPRPVHGDELPALPADLAVDVRDQGELLGALAVTMPHNDPIDPERERLVRGLASQAGLVFGTSD